MTGANSQLMIEERRDFLGMLNQADFSDITLVVSMETLYILTK